MVYERLDELLSYDPVAGKLYWKPRLITCKQHATWNSRYAGNEVGVPNHDGYLRFTVDRKKLMVHQAIWSLETGAWPVLTIDHINGDRADNRYGNLRSATRSQQAQNRGRKKTLGYKGVYQKTENSWQAAIGVGGRRIHLGTFTSALDAHHAYSNAAATYHGEFARAA